MAHNKNEVEPKAIGQPESSALDRRIAVLVFACSLIYLCIFRGFTAMDPDEGIILQGAERILHGQVLYRNFFSYFTPGSYYLLAGVFRVFGDSMLVARTVVALGGSILSVLTYLLARRVCSRSISLLTAALVTLTGPPIRFLVIHNWDSTLWACLAVYSAVRFLEVLQRNVFPETPGLDFLIGQSEERSVRGWGWALAAGSFCALTALFEQSKGAGLVFGLALGFLVIAAAGRRSFKLVDGIAFGAGLAWPFILAVAWFASQHALGVMLTDWLWPMHHYSLANRVPYGWQNWTPRTREVLFGSPSRVQTVVALLVFIPCFLMPLLPVAAVALWGYLSSRAVRARRVTDRSAYYIVVCGSVSGLLLSVLAVRADVTHLFYLAPLLYLVIAWVLDGNDIPSAFFRALRPALRTLVITTFGMLSVSLMVQSSAATLKIRTRRGTIRVVEPDTALPYLQAHVPEGSQILVYPYLPLYYYLSGTFSSNRYEYIQPGMHTAEESEEVIERLASDRTAVVLYGIDFSEEIPKAWPNTPLQSIARDSVGDFIGSHYHPCQLLRSTEGWKFVYMTRSDLACPTD